VKELCREREGLESSLIPPTINHVDGPRRAVVLKAEAVYAFPERMPDDEFGKAACHLCGNKEARDKDVRLHLIFQPRGLMCPAYKLDSEYTEVVAWDVALSPALYDRCPYPSSNKIPPKADSLWRGYQDFYPDRYTQGGYKDEKKKVIGKVKEPRVVPENIKNARGSSK
jgi:hypothetical protein